jgi:hypothetical protein
METKELYDYYSRGMMTAYVIMKDIQKPDEMRAELSAAIVQHCVLLQVLDRMDFGELADEASKIYGEIKAKLPELTDMLHKSVGVPMQQ